MRGTDTAWGENIVELAGEGADLLGHGVHMVRDDAHSLHAHAQAAQAPREEVGVRVLYSIIFVYVVFHA